MGNLRLWLNVLALVTLATSVAKAQSMRDWWSTPSLIAMALDFRHAVLDDSMRVDVCAIEAAFDARGSVIADSARIQYPLRSQCRSRSRSPRQSVEFRIERSVRDTVVLAADVTRRGIRYVERFHFVQKSGPVPVMTYCVLGWVYQ
jgi:hypothetical protein